MYATCDQLTVVVILSVGFSGTISSGANGKIATKQWVGSKTDSAEAQCGVKEKKMHQRPFSK